MRAHTRFERVMLYALIMITVLSMSNLVSAAIPNPGHPASSIGAGTFNDGNFTFPEWLNINGTANVTQTLLAANIIQPQGYSEIAAAQAVTVSGGTLNSGGPTYRAQDSYWLITSTGQTLTLNLTRAQNISAISFGTYNRTDPRYVPYNYTIENSSDDTTWSTLANVTNNVNLAPVQFVNTNAQYIRITVNAFQPANTSAFISGLQVFSNDYGASTGNTLWTISPNGTVITTTNNNVTITGGLTVTGNLAINGGIALPANSVVGANLNATNSPTDGYVLSYNSTTLGFTWIAQSTGSGSGNVTGGGIANYTARWINSSNIGTGIIFDNGTAVGINTTTPAYTIDVNGTARFSTGLIVTSGSISLPSGSITANTIENSGINSTRLNSTNTGSNGQLLSLGSNGQFTWTSAATGDVVGPTYAIDNAVVRFDTTTGKLIQNTSVIISDTNAVTGITNLNVTGNTNTTGTLFAGSTITGANGLTIQSGTVSLPSGSIKANTIENGSINATKLNSTNNPIDQYVLAYNSSTGGFTWTAAGAGTVTGTGAANYVVRWINASNTGSGTIQDNGTNVIVGTTAIFNSAYKFRVYGAGNDTASGSISIQNPQDNTSSGAILNIGTGTTNSSSGFVGAFGMNYTSVAAYRDRFVVGTNSDATGLVLYAGTAGQDIRFYSGGSTLSGLFDSNGNFIVNTSTLYVDSVNNKVGIGTATPDQTLKVSGNANITGNLYYGGNLTGYGADFAERMTTLETVHAGDVVCGTPYEGIRKCRAEDDRSVMGVVSTAPTITGNAIADASVPVGIVGLVPTKVTAPVEKYDLLTTSEKAGYATRADDTSAGAIIGKALEPCTEGTCTIKVLVGLR